MITNLNSRFGLVYNVTTKKDLVELTKKYLKDYELKEMLAKVNDYKNYECVDDGYLGVSRKSSRTYLVEIF